MKIEQHITIAVRAVNSLADVQVAQDRVYETLKLMGNPIEMICYDYSPRDNVKIPYNSGYMQLKLQIENDRHYFDEMEWLKDVVMACLEHQFLFFQSTSLQGENYYYNRDGILRES